MSWKKIGYKLKKKYSRNFVACDDRYERFYIIDLILEEFPYYTHPQVETAFDTCCNSVPAPMIRGKFIECLKAELR